MEIEKRKILVVDDSALMRRVLCDIINSDRRFLVAAKACDGVEAFDLLSSRKFDAVVLDINMPRMNGLELLEKLRLFKIPAKVLIASTDSAKGAKVTIEALELGALDFIQKPGTSFDCRGNEFAVSFLNTLYAVCSSRLPGTGFSHAIRPLQTTIERKMLAADHKSHNRVEDGMASRQFGRNGKKKIVAIACSTGGPRALQSLIPMLPKNIDAPVVVVQHMPKGFTASLAERLDGMSDISVREAQEGEILKNGVVYISQGGLHIKVKREIGGLCVRYSDEPVREGVKPCANYLYESLAESGMDDILCVVMTGMGSDGTEGIKNLKKSKSVKVITQDMESCVVYGMPKSAVKAGLSDHELPLLRIAGKIEELIGTEQTRSL